MRYTPTRPVTLKTPSGPRSYWPGESFSADPEKAQPYVEKGLLQPVDDQVQEQNLASLKARNVAIRIRSRVLGEDIWLASNEAVRDHLKAEGLAVYLAEEIQHLNGLSLDALREIHKTKKVFEKSKLIAGGQGRVLGTP